MKTKLLLLALFCTAYSHSQNPISESNGIGFLYYKTNQITPLSNSTGNEIPRAPMALELDWSGDDFDISNNPTKDSWTPRMDVDGPGNIYVVYNDNHANGLQKIMFRKKEGQNWSNPIFIDKGPDIGDRNNHFPAIAVSPNGDLHVSYNVWAFENGRNFIGYSHYLAASDTWSDGIKISDLNGTVNHTSSHHSIYSTNDNLPVVVWGFDNRENQVNEEIYLTYFDGANWSTDMAVSNITDGLDAGYPRIKGIGNEKAMVVYSEGTAGGAKELRYRIFDESTHTLSSAKVVTSSNIFIDNYVLTVTDSGDVMVLTLHKNTSSEDVFNIYEYNRSLDEFTLSTNSFEIAANAGGMFKQFTMDCNSSDDCAVIFTDYLAEKNFFLEYNQIDGFGTPEEINDEQPSFDPPYAKFDASGNLHVVWADMRFDDGQGFDEREIFYKMGENTVIGIQNPAPIAVRVYPNPSHGIFNIAIGETCTAKIYNVMGKLVYSEEIEGQSTFTLNLPSGTYFLNLFNEKLNVTKKLIIK